MDRHFVIQDEYVQTNTTGRLIEFLLQNYSNRMLDTWEVNKQAPTIRTFKSERGYNMKVIPVGYLEFVQQTLSALRFQEKNSMPPLEIPEVLFKYLNRMYIPQITGADIIKNNYTDTNKYFIKNIDKLKAFNSSLQLGDIQRLIEPESNYSVSEKIEILSEYRILVCKNEVVDVGFYNGDCLVFPDRETIINMIKDYSMVRHPEGYTIDVAVAKGQ